MRQAPSAVNAALNAAPVATFVTFFSEGMSKGVTCLRFGASVPVWTSTSELGYEELCEPPRHRADTVAGKTSRRWREGASTRRDAEIIPGASNHCLPSLSL